MTVQLEVLTAGLDPPPCVLIKGKRASLGRGPRCDVRIPDPSLSLLHASIVKRGQNYLLIDEGSHYGTGVSTGGEPVWLAADSPRILEDGEHIWLGQIELRVRLIATVRGAETGLDDLAERLVAAGLTAAGLEPTEELVRTTLDELTTLPDQEIPLPPPDSAPGPTLGIADLFDEDKHPPWKADLAIAALALLITATCALMYLQLT